MSRPVKLDATGTVEITVLRGEEHYWSVIRDIGAGGKPFRQIDIVGYSNGDTSSSVSAYIRKLERAGFIEKSCKSTCGADTYQLVHAPRLAPVLTNDGKLSVKGKVQDYLWRTMKMIGQFTVAELCGTASTDEVPIKEQTARNYVSHLFNAGYLLDHGRAPSQGGPLIFSLRHDMRTGPRAPRLIGAKIVFDPNLGRVMSERVTVSEAAS